MASASPVSRWLRTRTYRHADYPAERLRAERTETVSVIVPTRECAATIPDVIAPLVALREADAIDEVLVVDAASADGTAALAAEGGADVVQQADLLPEHGPVLGKGDAMWRALSVVRGDVVAYVDGDSTHFGPHFPLGVCGPLVCEPGVAFVKAFYRRPFRVGDRTLPEGGGRVTELTARPLLNLFWPELAGFRQPLAGELAARRELLERLPFVTGYGVEIAMLIDVHAAVGLDAMAQVDLEVRQNEHQPLAELAPMAYAVLGAAAERLRRDGRLAPGERGPLLCADGKARDVPYVERPPMAEVRAGAGG